MYCPQCGAFSDGKFCPKCGAPMPTDTQPNHYNNGAKFQENSGQETTGANKTDDILTSVKNGKKKFDSFVGADQNIKIKFSDLFSEILKKHSKEERDDVLLCGTVKTTPKESEIASGWSAPWVFSRFFFVLIITFLLLYICTFSFNNDNTIAGMIFIGSLAVPFSVLLFFWEANVPRNMSFFDILSIFFIGGTLSLVTTLLMFQAQGNNVTLDYGGAIIVGIIEEISKFAICLIYVKKYNTKYILNALLIGAAIGAGFAVFESAGYALRYSIQGSLQAGIQVLFTRAFLAGGGHIVWAAITCAAFVLVKRDKPFSFKFLQEKKFLILFCIPVVLHSIWDMPINFLNNIYFVQILLTVIAWMAIIPLFRSGLSQINEIKTKLQETEQAENADV